MKFNNNLDFPEVKKFVRKTLTDLLGDKQRGSRKFKDTDDTYSVEHTFGTTRSLYTIKVISPYRIYFMMTFTSIPIDGEETKILVKLTKDWGLEALGRDVRNFKYSLDIQGEIDFNLKYKKIGKFKDFLDL